MASGDNKALYSEASGYYVENNNSEDSYLKSKGREEKYNEKWNENKVNINEIIDEFAPDFTAKEHGSKMIFYGSDYNVVADMASGYLRIYDNNNKCYVMLDGMPGTDAETHFKIKKREEM